MDRKKQPTSLSCFVCGIKNDAGLHMHFYDIGPGEVEALYTVDKRYQGYPGIVHGGILAAMMDEVTGRVFMQGEIPRFMVTAELKLRYRKPVPIDVPLKLHGIAIKDNGRVGKAIGTIQNMDGETLVESEIVVVNIPKTLNTNQDYEAIGWRVYPE
jgi:acyl-coenzyme A thioesterase PaaI-like protein